MTSTRIAHGFVAVYAEIMDDGIPLTGQDPVEITKDMTRYCLGCQARISRIRAAYGRRRR